MRATILLMFLSASLNAEVIPINEAKEIFAQASAGADRNQIWPVSMHGPIMLIDPVTRQLVANQLDKENKLTLKGSLGVGVLPRNISVANTSVEWAGVRWAMIMWPLPRNPYARTRLLLHESFHRIQPELGLAPLAADNSHLDSVEGRIWLRLEWRALSEALIRDDDKRRQAIRDALIFRTWRRTLLPAGVAGENALEINEGLSEYTGLRLSGLPGRVIEDRASIGLAEAERKQSYVRNFAYASGPAYGLLLDSVDTKWRDKLVSNTDLGEKLRVALKLKLPEDLARKVHDRSHHYDGIWVAKQERQRAHENQAQLTQDIATFVTGTTLALPLNGARYTFDPNQVRTIPDHGTLYLTGTISSDWGALDATHGYMSHNGVAYVPLAPGSKVNSGLLETDAWTLQLNDQWRLVESGETGNFVVRKVP